MQKTISECETCPIKGYSPELCKMHLRHLATREEKDHSSHTEEDQWLSLGRKAVIGACIGVTGALVGMAALPSFGMKAMLGHYISAKVAGAGGIIGAGANLAINYGKGPQVNQSSKKRGYFVKGLNREMPRSALAQI